jgi:hypothetical protein
MNENAKPEIENRGMCAYNADRICERSCVARNLKKSRQTEEMMIWCFRGDFRIATIKDKRPNREDE